MPKVQRAEVDHVRLSAALLVLLAAVTPAAAERVENEVAIFAALDKVTARISKLEVPLNATVKFGSLKVTPRVCYSRPPTEQPKTTSFVDVEEVQLDNSEKKIFSGWMFAESPGLNAVEHPVFDVWLTKCEKPSRPVVTQKQGPQPAAQASGEAATGGGEDLRSEPRRRVRR